MAAEGKSALPKFRDGDSGLYVPPRQGPVLPWLRRRRDLLDVLTPEEMIDLGDSITPYNSRLDFSREDLTAYGGYVLISGFSDWMGVEQSLREGCHMWKRESKFSPTVLNMLSLDAIILGVERIWHINKLKADALLPRLRGLAELPDQSTLNRHLNSFSLQNVGELKAVAEQLLVKANCTTKVIDVVLDFDTTVATVYGKQEEAAVGYNPRKKGRRSYCIKVSFLGHNSDAANWRLDSGDTHALNGFQEFYLETVSKLPANYRVRYVRLDKGFAGDGTFRFLEGERVGYIAAIPGRERMKQQAQGIPGEAWHRVSPRLHVAEVEYQCVGWKQPRRFIVKKELVEEKGHHKPIQGSFFPQHRFRVEYSFYVTNIQGHSPVELWSFYNSRANVENRIKEAKLGFNLEHLPSRLKAANEAYISLVFLAHNILNWFKRFLLKGMARLRNIAWIRNFLVQIPAIVEKVGHWWHLRLPKGHPYGKLMVEVHRELARASPLRS